MAWVVAASREALRCFAQVHHPSSEEGLRTEGRGCQQKVVARGYYSKKNIFFFKGTYQRVESLCVS